MYLPRRREARRCSPEPHASSPPLLTSTGKLATNDPFFVADAEGTKRFQWPGNGGLSEPYWCADGHRWVEVQFSGGGTETHPTVTYTGALLHDAAAPDPSPTLPAFPKGMQGLDILAVVSPDQIIARTPDPVRYGPSKDVASSPTSKASATGEASATSGSFTITTDEVSTPRAAQEISVWRLGQTNPLHRWSIRLPGVASEVQVSPHGDQVAWLLSPAGTDMRPTALREETESLWVSRLDGGGMRRIGTMTKRIPPLNMRRLERKLLQSGDSLDAATQKQLSYLDMPSQVRWLPSGRAVSFQYQGALWVVSVD